MSGDGRSERKVTHTAGKHVHLERTQNLVFEELERANRYLKSLSPGEELTKT